MFISQLNVVYKRRAGVDLWGRETSNSYNRSSGSFRGNITENIEQTSPVRHTNNHLWIVVLCFWPKEARRQKL